MISSNKGIKILLVEDNESDRYLLESILDTSVIKVDMMLTVDTVALANDTLLKDSFDIIILDLSLPDSAGIDTYRSVNKHAGKIPIIILSGISDMNIAMEAISLGAQDYLLKDDLSESLLTKSILYSIERNRNIKDNRNHNEQYLLIRKSELEAIKSLELASQIINAALDSIVCMDKYGKIIAWNPQAAKLFGWQEYEILGKTLTETIIPKEYKEVHEAGVKKYIETGDAPFLNKLNEIITIDRTGRKIPVEFNFVQINEDDSHFFCAFIRDIRVRKIAENKKEAAIAAKLAVGEFTKTLGRIKNLDELFELTIDAVQKIFTAIKVSIVILNKNGKMEYVAARNLSDTYKAEAVMFNPWDKKSDKILPIYIEKVIKDPIVSNMLPYMQEEGIVSLICIPLIHQENFLGRVMVYFPEEHLCNDEERSLVENLSSIISISISEIQILHDLKKSEEKYRTLIEQASDPIITYSLDGKITDYNSLFMSSTGYVKTDINQLQLTDLLFKEDLAKKPLLFNKILSGQRVHDIRIVRRKDGSMMHAELNSKLMPDGNVMVIARDISERIKAEKQLEESYEAIRRLTSHIQDIREEERTVIAKLIHDELGQKLTVMKMDVSWLKTKLESEKESVKSRVNEIIKLLDETVGTVRRMSLDLRPSLLDDLGLVPAMEWHLGEFEKQYNITTNFVHEIDEIGLSNAAKTSLYRIFQESLTNVARHSLAECVTVSITKRDKNLVLSIDDNGIGFDKENLAERKTLGILGMEERMTTIGGKYEINSEKGRGTEVLVQLQLN